MKKFTLDEITDILSSHLSPDATSHPDDLWMRAQNDLLDDLLEDFRSEAENTVVPTKVTENECSGNPCTCTNGIGCVNVPYNLW